MPNGFLIFAAIPTKFTVILASYVFMGSLTGELETYSPVPNSFKYLVGSTVLSEWTRSETEEFFTRSTRDFLDRVEAEIQERGREIGDKLEQRKGLIS